MSFRYLHHTADVRARVTAAEIAGIYSGAVDLFRDLVVGSSPVEERQPRTIDLEGDDEQRCFHFLRELLFLYDTERFVPATASLHDDRVEVAGEIFDPERHQAEGDLKAVTHHGFELRQDARGDWVLDVVFDI